jgi:hypothetical protein
MFCQNTADKDLIAILRVESLTMIQTVMIFEGS